jgi:DNA polymerase-4
MRTILHVDLDAFFVAVEQALDPSLRGRCVVVGGDHKGRGVATASYEARRYGLHSGMPLATAQRLCPQAVFLRGDFHRYEEASHAFHAILRDFSPLVESGGLDEAYLDLTGCEPVAGAPLDAARRIRARVRDELSLAASVGVATSKTVAKIASDAAKPDGLLEVVAGQEAAFAPMPVRHPARRGPRWRPPGLAASDPGTCRLAGEARLRGLFGRHGPRLAERARGIDPSLVLAAGAPAKSVSREGTFAYDVSDVATLRAVLRGYCESVGADLRRMGRRARSLTIKLRYGDFTTITRSLTVDQPTHRDLLYAAAERLLDAALARRPPLRLIGFGASNLAKTPCNYPWKRPPGSDWSGWTRPSTGCAASTAVDLCKGVAPSSIPSSRCLTGTRSEGRACPLR